MGGSLRLGRIFGIPIEVNASWAVAFVLLTFLLSQEFRESRLGWPEAQRWLVAVAVVILIFLSVLTHELSHSVLARREGVRVGGITLFIFGGVSRLAREPDRPLTEFTIAVVGPLTSLVLAGVFGGVWFLLDAWEGGSTPEVIFFLLAWSNLALGLFNILPGYPLDGGRVLRAIVWGITGSHRKATRVAARAGPGHRRRDGPSRLVPGDFRRRCRWRVGRCHRPLPVFRGDGGLSRAGLPGWACWFRRLAGAEALPGRPRGAGFKPASTGAEAALWRRPSRAAPAVTPAMLQY